MALGYELSRSNDPHAMIVTPGHSQDRLNQPGSMSS
jgi:hypothetical protein